MRISPDGWLPLKDLRITPEGRWESSVQLGPSSEWFSGHFDGYPLVPGVALLAMTAETVRRQGCEQGRSLEVSGFSGVRFRRLAFPGEELLISVGAMPPESEAKLDFHVTCHGNTIVQGVLKAAEALRGERRDDERTLAGTETEDRRRTRPEGGHSGRTAG